MTSASPSATLPVANRRLQDMLHAPVAATLIRLSWPNMLMMLAQASTGLIETWFLAKLGTDVLAGVAVIIPVLMLMQNMSQGAMGGGISSAIARALGADRRDDANHLVRHAVALNAGVGTAFTLLLLSFGPTLFRLLGAEGPALDAAAAYGHIVFAGLPLMWTMNALASAIRGTGNMLVPGAVICGGAILLVPLSPCLIFGFGPLPALGVVGGAWALIAYYLVGTLILGAYCLSGRNPARLVRGGLNWPMLRGILVVGGVACLNSVLTNTIIAASGALVGAYGGTAALAGYATAARLEYLLLPIAFGLGAPMVAMVASNIGAGQNERARRVALAGGAMAFTLAETIGLIAAVWPDAWLRLFGTDEHLLQAGAAYLRMVGPFYGFFAMGFSLYFASQGAGKLKWPLTAGALRLAIYVGLGGAALAVSHSLTAFYAMGAIAMVTYGSVIVWSVAARTWFRKAASTKD